ncbi:coatomer complex protein [Infundibulicybe gibba]|nr:coatomer complex protein [Infundibulicybe gibba]
MESSELYHVSSSAYKTLASLPLPEPSSADYIPTLLYRSRAHIALNEPEAALEIIPDNSDNVAVKAVAALAQYVAADAADGDSALEELRDLSVEVEGEDFDGSDRDKCTVRVLAGTAFSRAGEIEEALETLGVAIIVQIYLSIHRPDLARKQFERSKRWAEDDLLLQLIESTIGLVTGKDGYANTSSFYTEQLGNPSLSSPHILTARGVTRILRNEIQEAKSDLDESLEQQPGDAEALAALAVAAGLGALKKPEATSSGHVAKKAELFDESAAKYPIPPLATLSA